jgi:uncharacterized protein
VVARGRGGVVLIGSGAGFVGGANVVAHGRSKAFNMVFAEALWCELKPSGVDVLGLILGETDTPALGVHCDRAVADTAGMSTPPTAPPHLRLNQSRAAPVACVGFTVTPFRSPRRPPRILQST